MPVRSLCGEAEYDRYDQGEEDTGEHEEDGHEAHTPPELQGEPDGASAGVHQNGALITWTMDVRRGISDHVPVLGKRERYSDT